MLANITESIEHGGPYVFGWAKLMLMQQLAAVHLALKSNVQAEQLHQILSKVVCSSIYISYTNDQSQVECEEHKQTNIKICVGNSCYPTSTDTGYYAELINSIKL